MKDRALGVPKNSVAESRSDAVVGAGPLPAVCVTSSSRFDRFGPRAWLLGAIRLYQLLLSPLLGPRCRFYPSCSHYAAEALRVHGAARGSWLAAQRVCRCHPFNPGGYDPVPPGHPVAGAETGVAEGRAT